MPATPRGRLIFARRLPEGTIAGIHEVLNGRRCDCVCPECRSPLIAKQGPARAHFAHIGGGGHGCGPGAWHEALCDAFASLDYIDLGNSPLIPRLRGRHRVLRASKERVLDGEFIPDALLDLQVGLTVAIEIVVSHDISGLKLAAMQQEGIQVLRIDATVLRTAMAAFPARRGDLVDLAGLAGPWQTWPYITSAPTQKELNFAPTAWWGGWLDTPMPPSEHFRR